MPFGVAFALALLVSIVFPMRSGDFWIVVAVLSLCCFLLAGAGKRRPSRWGR